MAPDSDRQHDPVGDPRLLCGLCRERIQSALDEADRLEAAGAGEQAVYDAVHQPRFATLREHQAFYSGLIREATQSRAGREASLQAG